MGQRLSRVAAAILFFLPACIGLAFAQGEDGPQRADLGVRIEGETYPFRLTAVNEDCETPQDFRFDLDSISWMHAIGPDTVRGLRAGEQGSVQAEFDFSRTSPGTYEGTIWVRCATCQSLNFNTCFIDHRQMVFVVEVRPVDDEVICRTFAMTGTRIPQEYCLTKREWDFIHEDSREIVERLLGTGTGTGAGT